MAKIESVIKAEIVRLAKREMRSAFLPLKREVRQMTIRVSSLSKGIASLNRLAKEVHLEEGKPKLEASPDEVRASRISPERIRSLRKKLGLSQREMGLLTGASLGAVMSWEKGKFKPRGEKKTALVALRKLGKRRVKELLMEKTSAAKKPAAAKASRPARRGRGKKIQSRQKPSQRKRMIRKVRLAARKMRKAA